MSLQSTSTPSSVRAARTGSDATTSGIRVVASPFYLADKSDPSVGKYTWGYRILIINESPRRAQLLRRRWTIVDGDGRRHDVEGEGVVGHQPNLAPGEQFEYASFCPLECPWGTMEGTYTFAADAGDEFDVRVGRFFLISPHV